MIINFMEVPWVTIENHKLKNKFNLIFILLAILLSINFSGTSQVPSYLEKYTEAYRENPRAANLKWFKDAQFGMFIHYGLYSQYI